MADIELDALDRLAAHVFEGYIVRKDLARRFKGRYPVPEYVAEFLLGRYCASTDEGEIAERLVTHCYERWRAENPERGMAGT